MHRALRSSKGWPSPTRGAEPGRPEGVRQMGLLPGRCVVLRVPPKNGGFPHDFPLNHTNRGILNKRHVAVGQKYVPKMGTLANENMD